MPSTGSSYVGHRAESTAPSDRVRRVVDVSLATLLLVAILPLLGAIAVLVKLSSRGPILIRQARIGFGGRVFYPTKFRTMYQSPVFPRGLTEHLLRSDPRVSADLAGLMLNHDPRLTPIGKLLRRSSLDELPTLVNVILGDMSLVGPRAPLPAEAGAEPSWAQVRYSVAPGLVSPTVLVTDHYDYEAMLALEVDYIQHFRSVQWDLRIIMETFRWSFAGGSLPLTDLGVEAAFVRTLLAKGGQRVANSTLEQVIDQMASA